MIEKGRERRGLCRFVETLEFGLARVFLYFVRCARALIFSYGEGILHVRATMVSAPSARKTIFESVSF